MPIENKEQWVQLHDEYYGDKVESLTLPQPPDTEPQPEHWNILLPVEERLKQFLKEYMEESFFPWFWTLQELYLVFQEKIDPKIFKEIINVKLYKMADHQLEKIRLTVSTPDPNEELTDVEVIAEQSIDISKLDIDEIQTMNQINEDENTKFEEYINEFMHGYMKDVYIEPYWSLKNDKKSIKVKLWKNGESMTDKRGLDLSIEMGIITGETVKKHLPFPHDLEYEKTFWPFLILTKKRYVGNKYEFDNNKFKKDFMGIVLKRRDNAPIVKEVCNGIIDALINHKDPEKARKYTKDCLSKMFNNEYDINYFLTSKTLKLKESYKDWTRIAHVVLAERIGIRDPGNKPQSGDRIEFAVIKIPNKTKETLQGEIIETPKFIKEQNLTLDYVFYMNNQIMNPSLQFLDLAIKDAKDIFNPYIYADKIEELLKEKKEICEFLKIKFENLDAPDGSEAFDVSSKTIIELEEIIDTLKKEIRKLKTEKRRYIKQNTLQTNV